MRDKSAMRIVAIAVLAALVAGCGGDKSEKLPVACTEGPGIVVKSLAKAPAAVTLAGTPISRCFNRNATGDDIQIVGTNLLAAAQEVADAGRPLQLGYLIGAAQRGSKRSGLGDEIVRRLQAESASVDRQPAYLRGLRAGLSGG
jgi:hypothetical protein